MQINYFDAAGCRLLWGKIKTLLNTKVDKIAGKGLSQEDYTTAEKTKLAGVEEGANNYVLPMATTQNYGGVKIGNGLLIDSNGKLAAKSYPNYIISQGFAENWFYRKWNGGTIELFYTTSVRTSSSLIHTAPFDFPDNCPVLTTGKAYCFATSGDPGVSVAAARASTRVSLLLKKINGQPFMNEVIPVNVLVVGSWR